MPDPCKAIDAQGKGTIINDDRVALSINSVSVREPETGTVDAVLTVNLSAPSEETVTVNYATTNGTALGGNDYVPIPINPRSTLTFMPGETSKTITVAVKADAAVEATEVFNVHLLQPSNAILAGPLGRVTILDSGTPR